MNSKAWNEAAKGRRNCAGRVAVTTGAEFECVNTNLALGCCSAQQALEKVCPVTLSEMCHLLECILLQAVPESYVFMGAFFGL